MRPFALRFASFAVNLLFLTQRAQRFRKERKETESSTLDSHNFSNHFVNKFPAFVRRDVNAA